MAIFGFKQKMGDLNRLREILGVIFEAGGGVFIKKMRLKYLVPWKCRIHCFFFRLRAINCLIRMKDGSETISPDILGQVLEKLGPTFVKFGQVLSLRADLVGEEISAALSKLQSDVSPFPYEEARKIIIEGLGKPPEELFKKIERRPVAAASLAQVHKAWLHDGTEVAVKVERPNIKKIIEQDIHILFFLASLAERFIPELRPYQPARVIREFADWTLRELDFKVEGNNAERFRFYFKENEHIKIPVIYRKFTSSKVLTMEFVHGVKADDLQGMKKLKVNARRLASYGVGAMFQQFLIDGFFHADPHPGNFFAMKGDVLCLHDFGMVGYLDEKQRGELAGCFVAFTQKNGEKFLKHFLHLAITSDASDLAGFQKDAAEILNEFFFSRGDSSVARMFFRIINNGAKRRVGFPADFALFGKTIVTAEAMGKKLYPRFNLNEELPPYVDNALKAYLDPRRAGQDLKTEIFDYLDFLKTLPDKTQSLLKKIEAGNLNVKIDASELLGIKTEFDRQNDLRIMGTAIIALFFISSIFAYLEGRKSIGGVPISAIGLATATLLFFWLVARIIKKPKK